MILLLQPLKQATELMSKEIEPTISFVWPTVVFLRKVYSEPSNSKSVEKMKLIMLNDLNNRYNKDAFIQFLQLCSLLDPRFKHLTFITPDEKELALANLHTTLEELEDIPLPIKQEPADTPVNGPNLPQLSLVKPTLDEPSTSEPTTSDSPTKKAKLDLPNRSLFNEIFITKVEPPKSKSVLVKQEVERYMAESVEQSDSENNFVLNWYKQRLNVYPRLARLARRYLACPASSVPSERLFSSAGNLLTKKRSCLKPDNVDKLLFLHKNW